MSGDGERREIKAEIFAAITDAVVRREVNELNSRLPVYKRIKTVVVRSEPFPRTASGKICLHSGKGMVPPGRRAETKSVASGRKGLPRLSSPMGVGKLRFLFVLALAASAIAVAVLGLVPLILRHYEVDCPAQMESFFDYIDLAGEILLGLFALLVVFWFRERGK